MNQQIDKEVNCNFSYITWKHAPSVSQEFLTRKKDRMWKPTRLFASVNNVEPPTKFISNLNSFIIDVIDKVIKSPYQKSIIFAFSI